MVYALSDIHGNMQNFDSVLDQIDLQPEDALYVLGDVIDRHPYGIEILQRIMDMPNAKMLLGNHEYMMLRALGCPYDGPEDIANARMEDLAELWLERNGGTPTYRAWNALPESRQADIVDYLHALSLNIDVEVNGSKYKLVHAAPLEFYEAYGAPENRTRTFFAVWNRDVVACMPDTDYTVVFGHTPTHHMQNGNPLWIYRRKNLIGIDCGSGFPAPSWIRWLRGRPLGRLACIRLDDGKEFYAQSHERQRKKA